MGALLIVVYFALLIGGLILALIGMVLKAILEVIVALLDRPVEEPEVIEPIVLPREVVAVKFDPRSISEKRLDRYCGTW